MRIHSATLFRIVLISSFVAAAVTLAPVPSSAGAGKPAVPATGIALSAAGEQSESGSIRTVSASTTTTTTTTTTTNHALLGAYVQSDNGRWTQEAVKASVTALETRLGRKLDIDHHYYGFEDTLPDWKMKWDASQGRIPMASWTSPVVTKITSGSQDAYLRAQAHNLAVFNRPVLLRFAYEMDVREANSVGPATFISAWRRVHDIFVNNGATKVRWVWCPSAYGFVTGDAQRYYPGPAYVDWICADGYNWGTPSDGKWRQFAPIFQTFYAWAAPKAKPIMIGETGTREGYSGWKATWFWNMRSAIKTQFPRIRALVYFDSKATRFGGSTFYDWRVDTSASARDAFTGLARDPYFTGSHGI